MDLNETLKAVNKVQNNKVDLDRLRSINDIMFKEWEVIQQNDFTNLLYSLTQEEFNSEVDTNFDVDIDVFEDHINKLFQLHEITKKELMEWMLNQGVEKDLIYFDWFSQFME